MSRLLAKPGRCVVNFEGKEALSINAFMYRERGILIGYFLCEKCTLYIHEQARKHPYQETPLHAKIEANLRKAYHGSAEDETLLTRVEVSSDLTIARIIDSVSQHIRYDYGIAGAARLPVVAIYSVYNLLMSDVKKYEGKTLAPLESHTSPDFRSKALGDIEVKNPDGSCFEAIEIKHNKPITADMIGIAFRKIKSTSIIRYYILTTHEPNFNNYDSVAREIEKYKRLHPCEIVVNGVIHSLKYYMRLVSHPQRFVDEYTRWLEFEYKRASAIKKEHLRVWQEICQRM